MARADRPAIADFDCDADGETLVRFLLHHPSLSGPSSSFSPAGVPVQLTPVELISQTL